MKYVCINYKIILSLITVSSIVITLRGTCRDLVAEVAVTASGGATMAPNKNPIPQLKYGIKKWQQSATLNILKRTKPTESPRIGVRKNFSSCQDIP
ncbi:MAG: hypothetical protein QG651_518 [Pseudomonadota bacterium]|nr:hypothetical protein [Pseudomonadota bacterium]